MTNTFCTSIDESKGQKGTYILTVHTHILRNPLSFSAPLLISAPLSISAPLLPLGLLSVSALPEETTLSWAVYQLPL